jgi:hypothetical protein
MPLFRTLKGFIIGSKESRSVLPLNEGHSKLIDPTSRGFFANAQGTIIQNSTMIDQSQVIYSKGTGNQTSALTAPMMAHLNYSD